MFPFTGFHSGVTLFLTHSHLFFGARLRKRLGVLGAQFTSLTCLVEQLDVAGTHGLRFLAHGSNAAMHLGVPHWHSQEHEATRCMDLLSIRQVSVVTHHAVLLLLRLRIFRNRTNHVSFFTVTSPQ